MSLEKSIEEDPTDVLGDPNGTYFARFGNFILNVGYPPAESEAVHETLVASLRADSRVRIVDPGLADHEWTSQDTWYPSRREMDRDALLSGKDHFHTFRFSDAILFEVHVPGKNQPVIHGKAAEQDSYEVAWDGCTAVVMWNRESGQKRAPTAAGQVVVDILEEACKKSGYSLYVQACSPACKHLFAHKNIRVSVWQSDSTAASFEPESESDIDFYAFAPYSGLTLVEFVHDQLKVPAGDFAQLKNIAKRIIDLEREARAMTIALIEHDYVTLKRSQETLLRRAGYKASDAWMTLRGGGRSREANLLIASLWLAMASLETLQQAYGEVQRQYKASVIEYANPELFARDLVSDEATVAAIDPQFPKAAIEHKSTRMDNRIIVWATVGGATAGATITAAAGGLLT